MGFRMLKVFGPFKVPSQRHKSGAGRMIGREHDIPFWNKANSPLLKRKQGCYIFALRAGRGATPWYVGKAGKSFQQECFTPDKLNKYNEALFKGKKGTPVLFFVALPDKKKKIAASIIKDIETHIIRLAKDANPHILNKSKTKSPRWGIERVIRGKQGKPNSNETAFRKMLGL